MSIVCFVLCVNRMCVLSKYAVYRCVYVCVNVCVC